VRTKVRWTPKLSFVENGKSVFAEFNAVAREKVSGYDFRAFDMRPSLENVTRKVISGSLVNFMVNWASSL
jgi:hypothetical protein